MEASKELASTKVHNLLLRQVHFSASELRESKAKQTHTILTVRMLQLPNCQLRRGRRPVQRQVEESRNSTIFQIVLVKTSLIQGKQEVTTIEIEAESTTDDETRIEGMTGRTEMIENHQFSKAHRRASQGMTPNPEVHMQETVRTLILRVHPEQKRITRSTSQALTA